MNQKNILLTACILGFTGVALGAFGAHALKPTLLASSRLETYELAVRYQFYHALALLFLGLLKDEQHRVWTGKAAIALTLGVALFSGSLYVLCLSSFPGIAYVTPFGGVAMLAGWALVK